MVKKSNKMESSKVNRVNRVVDLINTWADVFRNKNSDCGSSYILTGKTISLWFPDGIVINTTLKSVFYGLLTRMLDKLIRSSNLILRDSAPNVTAETIFDTLGDLGMYAFMTAEAMANGIDKKEVAL